MRYSTALNIIVKYEAWREQRPGFNQAAAAKMELDDVIRSAVREWFVYLAYATVGRTFKWIGANREWPRAGEIDP